MRKERSETKQTMLVKQQVLCFEHQPLTQAFYASNKSE